MLRFTIRDVLWLAVVVGLTTGWWMHYRFLQTKVDQIDRRWAITELRARQAESDAKWHKEVVRRSGLIYYSGYFVRADGVPGTSEWEQKKGGSNP